MGSDDAFCNAPTRAPMVKAPGSYRATDHNDDLYIIGAVCLSVGHKSDYFQAERLKVSRNRRNDKKCLEIGEILFLPFLDTFQK